MKQAAKLIKSIEITRTVGVPRSTLRSYEVAGLIEVMERVGPTTFYREDTIERVNRITRLREELGVNLAGVQVILEMREKIENLQQNLEEVVRFVKDELKDELARCQRRNANAVIPRPLANPPAKDV